MKLQTVSRCGFALFSGWVLLLACAAAGAAQGSATHAARVHLSWAPTANLSEIKNNPGQRGWLKPQEWMKQLQTCLERRADSLLPPGQTLDVRIDDIKLAGAFEPWRGANAQDIRFMKDIYPPRIDLHFTLRAADGSVLREGDRKLRDMAYLQHPLSNSTDPLGYDKRLIGNWLYSEFGRGQP
jgi:hypothetical protein